MGTLLHRRLARAVVAGVVALASIAVGVGPGSTAQAEVPGCPTVAGLVTCTFSYNGTDGTDGSGQTWVVPAGVTRVHVTAAGAQGGGALGGLGGSSQSNVAVTPGETLWIYVGGDGGVAPTGAPLPGPGGFNGGGFGLFANGGGATDVRQGADDLDHRVIVAGGGGGAISVESGGGSGGAGGGVGGGPGGQGLLWYDAVAVGDGGSGASASAGGAGGWGDLQTSVPGIEGSGGPGGPGVGGSGTGTGGGGGLFGGGAGGFTGYITDVVGPFPSVGGGGGGSGLVPGGCASPTDPAAACTAGVGAGHGSVVITYLAGSAPSAPTAVTAVGGRNQAVVSWSAPSDNGGLPITGYVVTPFIGAVAQPPQSFNGTQRTHVVTGLIDGTGYTFRVAAVNAAGPGTPSAPSAASVPPYASATTFVQQAVLGFQGRAATSGEVASELTALNSGAAPAAFVAGLRRATDAVTIVDPVARLYFAYFLRPPDAGGLAYWDDQRRGGRSLRSISDFFASSREFQDRYGSLSNSQFVALVYQNVLGRPGDVGGLAYWIGQLNTHARTRGGIMVGFSESPEYRAHQGPAVDVVVTWIGLLGRSPDAPLLAAWVADLTSGSRHLTNLAADVLDRVGISAAPAFLTAQAGDGQATLRWWAPAAGGSPITGYVVTPVVGGVPQAPRNLASTATTQAIAGLSNGVTYTFRVAARNVIGVGPEATTSPVTIGVPAAPVSPAGVGGNRSAVVTWATPADNGAPITGYRITPYLGGVAQASQLFASAATVETVSALANGSAYTFRVAAVNSRGIGAEATTASVKVGLPATAIGAANHTACAVLSDHTVDCWGANDQGQLGFPASSTPNPNPSPVPGLTDVTAVAGGLLHQCALHTNGTVSCWGYNGDGELGDGTWDSRPTPAPVSGLTTAVAITAGNLFTCALRKNGSVVCWGGGYSGQLGNGHYSASKIPVLVTNVTGATAVAASAGYDAGPPSSAWGHACALLGDHTVKCWGFNGYGEIGDGTQDTDRPDPVPVAGLTGVTAITTGAFHSCAVHDGGAVSCWGSGVLSPTPVAGINGAVAVAGGAFHSCALLSGGTVACWGTNTQGQLGDGTTTDSPSPVAVVGVAQAKALALSTAYSCALISDGTEKCWGANDSGQLGDGTTANRPTPVAVRAL